MRFSVILAEKFVRFSVDFREKPLDFCTNMLYTVLNRENNKKANEWRHIDVQKNHAIS